MLLNLNLIANISKSTLKRLNMFFLMAHIALKHIGKTLDYEL